MGRGGGSLAAVRVGVGEEWAPLSRGWGKGKRGWGKREGGARSFDRLRMSGGKEGEGEEKKGPASRPPRRGSLLSQG